VGLRSLQVLDAVANIEHEREGAWTNSSSGYAGAPIEKAPESLELGGFEVPRVGVAPGSGRCGALLGGYFT
jgi:hypothetical protein